MEGIRKRTRNSLDLRRLYKRRHTTAEKRDRPLQRRDKEDIGGAFANRSIHRDDRLESRTGKFFVGVHVLRSNTVHFGP